MDRFQVTSRLTEFWIDAGKSATVTNIGSATVYGSPDAPPTSTATAAWSLAPGASRTEDVGAVWVLTAAGTSSTLTVEPIASGLATDTGTGVPSAIGSGGSGGYVPAVTTATSLGSARTVTFSGEQQLWLTGTLNANLAITSVTPSAGCTLVLLGVQDGTGGWTLAIDGNNVPIPSDLGATVIVVVRWVDATTFRVDAAASNPMTTAGDIIIGGVAGALARLAAGSTGQVLTISGGVPAWQNASGGAAALMPLVAAKQYMPPIVMGGTNVASTQGLVKAVPFVPGRSCTIDSSKIQVNTAATAGGTYRVAIFTDNAGVPGTLVDESDQVAVTGTGIVTITGLSAAVTAGNRYWVAGVQQGSPATPATFKGVSGSAGTDPAIPADTSNLSLGDCMQYISQVTASLSGISGASAGNWGPGSGRPAISIGAST